MKPKYSLKNNFLYAMEGAKEVFKEVSFKIEIFFFVLMSVVLVILSYPLWAKIFMFSSMLFPVIAEIFNTAIEKTVDLASEDFHHLAKKAKDIAAFGVFVSVFIPVFVWGGFIIYFWS
jgi:diacylglycerol kinase (ATP)